MLLVLEFFFAAKLIKLDLPFALSVCYWSNFPGFALMKIQYSQHLNRIVQYLNCLTDKFF